MAAKELHSAFWDVEVGIENSPHLRKGWVGIYVNIDRFACLFPKLFVSYFLIMSVKYIISRFGLRVLRKDFIVLQNLKLCNNGIL
jgi:hypothetical protein